jgi:protein involved in polysaccharide export with SLBB domain
MVTRRWLTGIVVGLLLMGPAAVPAQSAVDWDPRAAEVSRQELAELLDRLEQAATAPGYSSRIRDQARREAEYIRARLEQGDFQVGDRVVLDVQGEPGLSDTVTVSAGREIELPQIGALPLAGVLRSELQDHLERELSRYLQNPSVRATSLVRVAILGAVARPGFYTVPATLLLEDAVMTAGGPAGRADISRLAVERGGRVVLDGQALQRAIIDGRTLDQLNVRAGDRIMLPERRPGLFEGGVLRTLLVTLPPILYLLQRIL